MRTRKNAVATALVVLTFLAWIAIPRVAFGQVAAPSTEGVQIDGEYGYGLPPAIYAHEYAKTGDTLIIWLHWFMLLLFVGWGIFFVSCLIRFRERPGHKANSALVKAGVVKWLEVGVACFEAFLLLGLAIPAWSELKINLPTDEENPFRVRVLAEQFAWNFHYPGPDGKFGRTAPQFVDSAVNILGIDPDDPFGKDDLAAGELHFAKDRPVIAEITSKDVIHSFFVPVLRVKQDAIPGMRFPVWFQATTPGNYEIACAQLCGNNHYSMKALMVVHETDQSVADWIESQRPVEFDEDDLD